METKSYINDVQDNPVLRNNHSYSVSDLGEKYGLSSSHGGRYNGAHPMDSDVIKGISPYEKREIKEDHTPKQVKEPERADRLNEAKKKYKIKGINVKDNVLKTEKNIGWKGMLTAGKNASKGVSSSQSNFKKFIISSIIEEDIERESKIPNGKGTKIFDWMKKNIRNPERDKNIDAESEAAKIVSGLVKSILGFVLGIIRLLFTILMGSLGAMVLPVFVIVLGGVIIIGFICLVVGMFFSSAAGGTVAVDYIDNRYAEIENVAINCDYFSYNDTVTSSATVMSVLDSQPNADDILLIYLSLISNTDSEMEGDAPYILMDSTLEQETIMTTLSTMISYTTETVKRKKYVSEFLGFDKDGHAKYETREVEYEINWLYLSLSDANSVNAQRLLQDENAGSLFKAIKDTFIELGYSAGGGDTVCSYFR